MNRGRISLGVLAGLALALLCALQALVLLRMPASHLPERITVKLAPGAAIGLGRAELAAPQAEARALRLRRDGAGRWWAASPRALQGLRFERGDARSRSGALALAPGMRFQLGARHYAVQRAAGGELDFTDGAHAWRYDGARVWRDGMVLPACPGASLRLRLLGAWNGVAPAALAVPRPLVFGGSLDCGTQVGNPDAAPGSAGIAIEDGVALLHAAGGADRLPLLATIGGVPQDLALAETALDGVTALTVGRTRMRLSYDGRDAQVLHLAPVSRVALYPQAQADLPPGVSWRWTRRGPWDLPAGAAAWMMLSAAAGIGAGGLAWRARYRKQAAPALRLGCGVALAVLGLGLLLAQRIGSAPGAAYSLLAACLALGYGLSCYADRRARPVLAASVLLLATGLLLQLELGAGAFDSSWLRYFQKTAAAVTLGLGLLGAWTAWPSPQRAGRAPQSRIETALLALAAAAIVALLAQVGWGDETGVADLQPVEFAKLALTVLAAHCVALGLGTGEARRGTLLRWLRLVAPALLFVVLLAVALVQVDDYSPLILLLVWGAAMLLAWSCAAGRRGAALAVFGMAGACVLGLTLLRGASPLDAAGWRFYGERFGVWLDPASHPHTGAQLLLGAEAIGSGGWFGADGALGLAALGGSAAAGLAIPAVQDDFAPSFLLLRHGLAAGLMLWALQALLLCALLQAALRAWHAGAAARNYHEAWRGRFRCFVLCGGGAFLFGHFLLSWGTNLAFFPIMGQPMSFLSAGGSHLLFFIFPLLALAAAGEPPIEEN